MNPSNNLKIRIDPSDWHLGDGNIKGQSAAMVPSGNWLPFIDFYERQLLNYGDTDGCVCFSVQEAFDAQIEVQIALGLIPAETIELFNQLGYMDTDSLDQKAHFHSSPRFLECLTGNGLKGNAIQDGINVIRNYGPLPYKDLPVDPTMTPQQYVDPACITQEMKDKAAQLLAAIGGKNAVQFHWICEGSENLPAMTTALTAAPLLLGVNVGNNWNVQAPPPPASGSNPGHCVMGFQIVGNDVKIYDHYMPNPKDLINYPIWYCMQMIVTVTPPPPAPVLPPNPTLQQEKTWLDALPGWLKTILTLFQ